MAVELEIKFLPVEMLLKSGPGPADASALRCWGEIVNESDAFGKRAAREPRFALLENRDNEVLRLRRVGNKVANGLRQLAIAVSRDRNKNSTVFRQVYVGGIEGVGVGVGVGVMVVGLIEFRGRIPSVRINLRLLWNRAESGRIGFRFKPINIQPCGYSLRR